MADSEEDSAAYGMDENSPLPGHVQTELGMLCRQIDASCAPASESNSYSSNSTVMVRSVRQYLVLASAHVGTASSQHTALEPWLLAPLLSSRIFSLDPSIPRAMAEAHSFVVLAALSDLVTAAYSESESSIYLSLLYHLLLRHTLAHPSGNPSPAFLFCRRRDLPLVLIRQLPDSPPSSPLQYTMLFLLLRMLRTASPVPRNVMRRITPDLVSWLLDRVEEWPGQEVAISVGEFLALSQPLRADSGQGINSGEKGDDDRIQQSNIDPRLWANAGAPGRGWIGFHRDLMRLLVLCSNTLALHELPDTILAEIARRQGRCERFTEHLLHLLNRDASSAHLCPLFNFCRRLVLSPPTQHFFFRNDLRLIVDLLPRHLRDTDDAAISVAALRVLAPVLRETQWRDACSAYQALETQRVLDGIAGAALANILVPDDVASQDSEDQVKVCARWVREECRTAMETACARARLEIPRSQSPISIRGSTPLGGVRRRLPELSPVGSRHLKATPPSRSWSASQ